VIPCFAIDTITTPKGYILRGLWFGPHKPKRCIVWVHGLASSAFSMLHVVGELADTETAVLTFNNRGHDVIANVNTTKGKQKRAGAAHEVFTECVDDIQGAIDYANSQGVKEIHIAGHSTGCQKSVYWAAKTEGGKGVKGIILLSPVSDYAAAQKNDKDGRLQERTDIARNLVRLGKKHQLMPADIPADGSLTDAQRFLSLNTPDSAETVFPYEQLGKKPRTLQKVTKPILVLWAGEDEYADRPAEEIATWFDQNIKNKHQVVVIPGTNHGFRDAENQVAEEIKNFI